MALAPMVPLLVFSFLVLCNVSLGQIEQQSHPFGTQGSQRRFREQSQCQVQRLEALEPKERIESEAGVTEFWDENNKQFECAGVAALRHRIDPQGLLLPTYENAPKLIYIVQGRGFFGAVLPGCPESFQSIQVSQQREQEQRQRYQDQHQKIRQFRQGDIIAVPAGVPTWCYNDGETPVVAVEVIDTSNSANQLDQNFRRFHLAGNPKSPSGSSYERDPTQGKSSGRNVFSGFDVETLAEAFGVSTEAARKLQSQGDNRGNIVHVENGLQVVRPPSRREQQQEQDEGRGEEEEQKQRHDNGLEETLCHMRLKENIAEPEQADVYSPNGGRITSLNSQKLPILNYLQLSAERGVLYKNAILAPQWNINAHSVVYCTSGNGRIQIVGDYGRPVYDGELRRGQLVIVPQNFAVVKQAGNQGFEWIAFKTSNNAMTSPLVGRASALRGMPEAVLMNSYKISREEARRLKNNRGQETVIFAPRTQTQGRAFA